MQFCDLTAQYRLYRAEIDAAVSEIVSSGRFIDGPAVTRLEDELAQRVGARHAVACANGTDALTISLLALKTRPGDEVIVPDFTFIATAECVSLLGAVPVFVDVKEDDFTLDPALLESLMTERTKGIIAVSLFGQCADMESIMGIARRHGLWVIEDAAQSFGAVRNGTPSCGWADISTTSFFPTKPLGCYGDGGALFTGNDEYARLMRLLGHHGAVEKYVHQIVGLNSRLDAIQAAVVSVKLRHFDEELRARNFSASAYTAGLGELVSVPKVSRGNTSTWAQYTVRSARRDRIRASLAAINIPTMIHYPVPLHLQPAFASLPSASDNFPVTERLCREVFSLPMHPFLSDADVTEVVEKIKDFRSEERRTVHD
ncbi:MAG: DegT/DnrJ/EryC1/StrS family aminotransferase [Spirochaetales bacterium]|nr:DegT/DnrJ/EryC1/StrS family aminotransferase [Spirochaetales bacterium]